MMCFCQAATPCITGCVGVSIGARGVAGNGSIALPGQAQNLALVAPVSSCHSFAWKGLGFNGHHIGICAINKIVLQTTLA